MWALKNAGDFGAIKLKLSMLNQYQSSWLFETNFISDGPKRIFEAHPEAV